MELKELVEGFGATLKIEGLSLDAEGNAAFSADGMWVGIAGNANARTFSLTGRIGEPPAEGRDRLERMLLKTNALLSSESGMSVGLDADDRYVLLTSCEYTYMTLEAFAEKVEAFLNELERLCAVLEGFSSQAEEVERAMADSAAEARNLSEGGYLQV